MGEILMPDSTRYVLPRTVSSTLLDPRFIDVHTMVSDLGSARNHFSIPGNPYSHLGLDRAGYAEQWQDLALRAASDYEGNPYSISIETADGYPNWPDSDVPDFTEAQVDWLIPGIAWLCIRFIIPPVLVPDSTPVPNGMSYHRLGIDSYPDLYRPGWRQPGGLRFSTSAGKLCPGDRKIKTIRERIVPAVQALVQGDFLMALTPEEQERLLRRVDAIYEGGFGQYPTQGDNWSKNLPGRTDILYNERTRPALIVKGDLAARWWVVTAAGKRSALNQDHVKLLIANRLAIADGTDSSGNPLPFIWPQARIDEMPRLPTSSTDDELEPIV